MLRYEVTHGTYIQVGLNLTCVAQHVFFLIFLLL